ncbi:conserved hypothetical protein [Verminephrobacter eiseniae EF01-2]|uniref:DUF2442 domain-containing protein n=1 Tax=Verminephrobacter eiseniae (strain EF01-2) TaxID=391735 RepID=A1WSS9_VEREI|nr:DUF2442 domain-containing protein [Verminephrobacter eiseniae]ABM60686.1 conserved hypothetical protein [Verminephrobacter eiseniae EF01-2]
MQFRLRVHFVDGTQGIMDLLHWVHAPNAAVFSALADPAPFEQVFVEHGAVIWPGGIDVAPDAVCAQTKAHPSGP